MRESIKKELRQTVDAVEPKMAFWNDRIFKDEQFNQPSASPSHRVSYVKGKHKESK